jgi:hypothetical protein
MHVVPKIEEKKKLSVVVSFLQNRKTNDIEFLESGIFAIHSFLT